MLSSAFNLSPNGGSYNRLGKTLIIGSWWSRHQISDAPKVLVEPPQFSVATITNAIVCGEGIICKQTPRGTYVVAETLIEAKSARSILPLTRTSDGAFYFKQAIWPRRLASKHTYVLLRQVCDNNYGHWITEAVPKIAVLADHYDLALLKFIVSKHPFHRRSYVMRQIYIDTLAAFGIKPNQILALGRDPVEIERLLYVPPISQHPWIKAPRTIEILETLRDRIVPEATGPKRIYVSRANAGTRRLINEAAILDILKRHDVAVVCPERLSFSEQVRLFANAELVIGAFGANLANAAFAKRNVKIFALSSECMEDDFFWDLANLKSGSYFSLHGTAACSNPNRSSDFFIDPLEFHAVLEEHVLDNGPQGQAAFSHSSSPPYDRNLTSSGFHLL